MQYQKLESSGEQATCGTRGFQKNAPLFSLARSMALLAAIACGKLQNHIWAFQMQRTCCSQQILLERLWPMQKLSSASPPGTLVQCPFSNCTTRHCCTCYYQANFCLSTRVHAREARLLGKCAFKTPLAPCQMLCEHTRLHEYLCMHRQVVFVGHLHKKQTH